MFLSSASSGEEPALTSAVNEPRVALLLTLSVLPTQKGHSNNKVYTSGLSWLHIHLNLDESPNHMSRNFIIETKHCILILRVNTK